MTRQTKKTVLQSVQAMHFLGLFCALCFSFSSTVKADEAKKTPNNQQSAPVSIPAPIEGKEPQTKDIQQALEYQPLKIKTADERYIDFEVEIAKTPAQQAKGLMFREALSPNKGMLFLFRDNDERAFWMKNTFIPLDIVFIREDGVIHNIHHMAQPLNLTLIHSEGPSVAVLEIAGGQAKHQNINIGDRIIHPALQSQQPQDN